MHTMFLRASSAAICLLSMLASAVAAPAATPVVAPSVAAAGGRLYRIEAVPSWVHEAQTEYAAPVPRDDIDNGSFYVLFDRQVRVLDRGDDSYSHIAVRIVTQAGIDGNSQLDLSVDPDWQRLSVHFVRVVRDGTVINQLGRARISEFAQENEREDQIYNGNWTVNFLLSDLRVGDVVEYAYTTHSSYTLFAGHYWDHFTTSWTDPVRQQRMRVLYPTDRKLRYKLNRETRRPVESVVGNEREWLWEWRNVPAVRSESDTPDWYDTWSSIEITDMPDWGTVARLTEPLYVVPTQPDGELAEIIEAIRNATSKPSERLLRVLRFVQDEVRYAGIEIGQGSHRPRPPEQVVATRFGDCKDKTLLMTTMLRQLGIEATPVLVHTDDGPALAERLPTPYAFNHVIVRARIDGKDYWLDGTNSQQKGELASLAQPDFGWGLPIDVRTTALVAMPVQGDAANSREVHLTLDLSGNAAKPAPLTVISRYSGDAADAIRRDLDDMSRSERETKYLNYYAAMFPGIQRAQPYVVQDDIARNELRLTEHYLIDHPFAGASDSKADGRRSLWLSADEVEPYAKFPQTRIRSSPLVVARPARVRQSFSVKIPSGWDIEDSSVRVRNPAFQYDSTVKLANNVLELSYEYVALRDHVDAAAIDTYYADLQRMKDDLGYRLGTGGVKAKSAGGQSWFALLIAFIAGALTLRGLRRAPEATRPG